jgi:tellurite resistance protein TerA
VPIDYTKRPSGGGGTPTPSGPVSLTKRGEKVNLSKGASGAGPVRFNLNWQQTPSGGGLLKRRSSGIDLDLGCLYELRDGSKGAVQALGNSFGSLDRPPWVMLDKDDRSGSSTDGETLFVSAAHSADIKRLAVFAFIYEGVPNWSQAGGRVTIHPSTGPAVTIMLDNPQDGHIMCGICLVYGGPDGFTIERQVEYVGGHQKLDELYGWGMNWTRGTK